MDPFSLAAFGIGTAGSLGGAIYNAATLPKRKREWKREQTQQAQSELRRNWLASLGFPTAHMDALENKRRIDKTADENFRFDPTSLIPFVQNGTRLAGAMYDAAGSGGPDSEMAEYQQDLAQRQQDAQERAAAMQYFNSPQGQAAVSGYDDWARRQRGFF